jgi:nucleotide-binding universal stress UspA family protein
MFAKILVPLDGSALAEQSLPAAISLAQTFAAEICLVQVIVIPAWLWQGEMRAESPELVEMLTARELARASAYLRRQEENLSAQGIQVAAFVVQARLIDQAILDAGAEQGCDLIVMSTHGLSGLSRLLLGSVAERVVQRAATPVLLIRARPN